MSSNLEQELLRLEGVAEAQLDVSDGTTPTGVRVRLTPDADAEAVGAEVQRLLATHGVRSRLAGRDPNDRATTPDAPDRPRQTSTDRPGDGDAAVGSGAVEPPPLSAPESAPLEPSPLEETAAVGGRLSSLRVDETAEAVMVTATTSDGRSITHRADNSEHGLFESVVAAVGVLAEGIPVTLLAVEHATIDGSEVVTVVVERREGSRHAGAAVVGAARPYAVAVATWAALRG